MRFGKTEEMGGTDSGMVKKEGTREIAKSMNAHICINSCDTMLSLELRRYHNNDPSHGVIAGNRVYS